MANGRQYPSLSAAARAEDPGLSLEGFRKKLKRNIAQGVPGWSGYVTPSFMDRVQEVVYMVYDFLVSFFF